MLASEWKGPAPLMPESTGSAAICEPMSKPASFALNRPTLPAVMMALPNLGRGLRPCDPTRFDILIHAEQVFRIVLCFNRSEPRVIFTVCRLETPFSLIIHHEIHVSAAKVERMNGFPIRTSPRPQGVGPLRIGIDCSDHHRPSRVARIPRSGILCHAMDRPIDRIEMHQRDCAGSICRLRYVRFDGFVRQGLHKVS